MQEIWKLIEEGNGRYEVSTFGNIRNSKDYYLYKQGDNGKGYKNCKLWHNNKSITRYVHRLVAIAFIDNPNGYKEVNHKDENKSNNNLDNLEWCTRQYNNTYGSLSVNKQKKVLQYSLDNKFINKFDSISEASRLTGASNTHIGSVCRKERNQSGGYRWEYAI